jgi:methanogenic corrinoid protein MtbC1
VANVPPLGQFSDTPIFNTKAVVRETDVPADTFRAWERRYGVPLPQRTEGGHRLYSERDIAIIRWLRDRTAAGMNISQAVRLLQSSSGGDAGVAAPMPDAPQVEPRALQRLQNDLLEAMMHFDAVHAEQIMAEAFALYPFEDVLLHMVEPLMVEVGERWHRGEISVANEHFTTQFVRRKLAGLLSAFEPVTTRGTIVVACAPGELHDIGVMFVALFLMRRNWHVIYLGPQVPQSDLLETVRAVRPQLVCLSASLKETARQLIEVARSLQEREPQVHIGFGGRIFNMDANLRNAVPGTYLGQNAREVVSTVAALFPASSTSTSAS